MQQPKIKRYNRILTVTLVTQLILYTITISIGYLERNANANIAVLRLLAGFMGLFMLLCIGDITLCTLLFRAASSKKSFLARHTTLLLIVVILMIVGYAAIASWISGHSRSYA
jgi:hypothetical protein